MHPSKIEWLRGQRLKAALLTCVAMPLAASQVFAAPVQWQVVVNNSFVAPQSKAQAKVAYFFSYNQPAVNNFGQVVFRARAKPLTGESSGGSGGSGGGSQPTHGVYTRLGAGAINIVADNLGILVPWPNTTGATFTEFPSTPRADAVTNLVATRGQSTPVITLADGTKLGTSGVYAKAGLLSPTLPYFNLTTAASQVGSAPGYSIFQVPGEAAGTRFDQFPGSPSPLAGRVVTFKGNYTVGLISKTGVYYRDLAATSPTKLVVHSGDPIPGGGGKVFGSAAPPSSAVDLATKKSEVVFAGFDNEDNPTAGGIYLAELGSTTLNPLASIGTQVPTLPAGTTFNKFGEGISFDGATVSFWGAWGTQTRTIHKDCPTDGNADLIAYCLQQYPNGADLTVPVNQGIFTVNIVSKTITLIARTTVDGFTDFLYWTYSGKPPGGEGDGDAEPPRWRSSAFTAVNPSAMAFKGLKGTLDGIYVKRAGVALFPVIDTNTDGQAVDPRAPVGSKVSSIGLERDGFRGPYLAITAGMLNPVTTLSWAGIYSHNCGAGCTTW